MALSKPTNGMVWSFTTSNGFKIDCALKLSLLNSLCSIAFVRNPHDLFFSFDVKIKANIGRGLAFWNPGVPLCIPVEYYGMCINNKM